MATTTVVRNPLATRSHSQQAPTPGPSWQTTRKVPSAKRAYSPEPSIEAQGNSSKRAKAAAPESTTAPALDKKLLRRVEREQEFREKYSRAFPNWVFYFDLDTVAPAMKDSLGKRVVQMGARVDDFFSREVTHFVSQEDIDKPANKENVLKARTGQAGGGQSLDSPIRLKTRASNNGLSELIQKAIAFDLKIWNTEKLESVLDRSEPVNRSTQSAATLASTSVPAANAPAAALSYLLKAEKLNGTTERDPTQKRHDYVYFDKNSHFVLVEDMRQELATIIAVQYPPKGRDGKEKTYPVLHCHPLARGPFVPYDEKEERRREKQDRAEKEREQELRRRKLRLMDYERRRRAELEAKRQGELRRTQSMTSLRRRATYSGHGTEAFVDLDADYVDADRDVTESAAASGYLASNAYIAASGNSVGITSTTGTTSTSGFPFRTTQLPTSLREKLQHEVVTSRKVPVAMVRGKDNTMGPPPVPDRQRGMLRKSRSTNTMRLPKRDEASKPGYCESCRVKFQDFSEHIRSKKHHKFALDDANFANLDTVLARVKRRTLEEMEDEESFYGSSQPRAQTEDAPDEDEDATMNVPAPDPEWIDSNGEEF